MEIQNEENSNRYKSFIYLFIASVFVFVFDECRCKSSYQRFEIYEMPAYNRKTTNTQYSDNKHSQTTQKIEKKKKRLNFP